MRPRRVVPAVPDAPFALPSPDDPDGALLDSLGDLANERALVLGPDIGIMCGLIRRGCREVTELEKGDRPEARMVDLVVVPAVADPEAVVRAVAHARRALTPHGRIVVRATADGSGRLGRAIERTLRLHGFSLTGVRRAFGRTVFTGELPCFGPLASA